MEPAGMAARDIEMMFALIFQPREPGRFKLHAARNFLLYATGSGMLRLATPRTEDWV